LKAKYPPNNDRGNEMHNQRAIRPSKDKKGIAPELPLIHNTKLRMKKMAKTVPGKVSPVCNHED